ncbi:MAG: TonB-dependent receptor plug domain-containing protein, partial [Parvularculaceae bacterium]|nr:TonB-dependent receptor plug domain-containing protein [Parvularculaceae bacterium]
MKNNLLAATAAAALSCGLAAAQAQEVPAQAGAAKTYTQEDFKQFAPRTALDMLRQVPGFVIREEDSQRGLGEATGNVLINGKRPSGKSDDVVTQLSRIPAKNVVRIEIVDASTLGVPGLYGQAANVIVKASGVNGQFKWQPETRVHNTRRLLSRFSSSVSGEKGPVEFTLSLENRSSHGGADGLTTLTNADGSIREVRKERTTGEFDQPKAGLRLEIDGPGSSVANINASYRKFWFDSIEKGTRTRTGELPRDRVFLQRENGWNYEVGGDFEFALGPGRLKLIGLKSGLETAPEFYSITTFRTGAPTAADRVTIAAEKSEAVGRGEYRWKTGRNEWQVSAEAAFNSLDNATRIFSLQPNGVFAEIPLPGGTARVSEDRYEAIATWSRPLSKRLSLQIAGGAERSTLTQAGGGGVERTFLRPKGSATATWTASDDTTVSLRLKRRVGQLNFFDFLANVDIKNGVSNAGNTDLRPPQSWELEGEVTQKLGRLGSTTLRAYAHRISDIVDVVPIGSAGESVGNLDQASVYGFESKSTFLLDSIGWKGAKIDLSAQMQSSAVDDPLTGVSRPISNYLVRSVQFDFRYDIPDTDWAFGGGVYHDRDTGEIRLTEQGRFREGPA